ncbi:ADP-ribosylglycohydrolase family protein [Kouleothrix sp.]|uniref:ADP-ribosylglycohydrolase family protein n=1 Tax=Kouleothrix sp. TaxID=2779161 RepID=UPI00391CE979
MPLPPDYLERVYAGVLGKTIGVYLGRPFEGWTYEQIMGQLGEIRYYVHARRDVALKNHELVVTDDDLSGTFTFLRALEDYGYPAEIAPAQIAQTWLNYILPQRTVLWWGGVGNSTEHTAYLHLRDGVGAPESGSIARNGKVVAEQIGAQIFVDGWAMVAPGDPERAADLARRAASVSHDGEAIYGAQALAAMEALAFVEHDLGRLLDAAARAIPPDSVIARLYDDLRAWHAADDDWRRTRERIEARYGYQIYGGNCHIVPNHALILLGLLYGGDDFQRAMTIVNTSGWDTDCNSGNLGCLLGIRGGLRALDAGPDWRAPIADRIFLPTVDGGRCITDAVAEAVHVANAGRCLAGLPPLAPKGGARFHFELPGSLQGFQPGDSPYARDVVALENVAGHSQRGERSLALHYHHLARGRVARVATPAFIPPGTPEMAVYELLASPTLYPGQTVRAWLSADASNTAPVSCALSLRVYGPNDAPATVEGASATLSPGAAQSLTWAIPDLGGAPIIDVGLTLRSEGRADGTLYHDALTWDGTPQVTFTRPEGGGTMWRRAWVDAVDQFDPMWPEPFRIVQNRGRGLLIQGTRDWTDYAVRAVVVPHLARAAGLAARVQGLRRYYALLLRSAGMLQLVKVLDGETVLAEAPFAWELGQAYDLRLEVRGDELRAWATPAHNRSGANGQPLLTARDRQRPLAGGAVALVVEEGRLAADAVSVAQLTSGL